MNELLFFSAVDNGYQCFLPLYIYFAHKYNNNSSFEFCVRKLNSNFELLMKDFAKQFDIQNLKLRNINSNIPANSFRFLVEPETKCNYTYIGDVDIFINEDILSFHLNELKKYNTIYDNKIRLENHDLMSGLHFVKTNEWYEKTKSIRLKYLNKNRVNLIDEKLLKTIVIESKIKLLNNIKENTFNRPAHGIHISLNRKPFTQIMHFPIKMYKQMFINDFLKSDDWIKIKPYLSNKMINILNTCNKYVKNN